MRSGDILKLVAGTPTVLVSSGSAHTAFIETAAQDRFEATAPAPSAAITSNLSGWSRWQSTRGRKLSWLLFGSAIPLESTPAPQISASASQNPEPSSQKSQDAAQITQIFDPNSKMTEAASLEIISTRSTSKPSKLQKIELAIDSLNNYDLLKPIPILIESLGDTVFLAEAPDLNLSTTGNSVGAAFLLLKEQVVTTYEGYRSKKGADADRARQLAVFEQYIGKARRHWF